MRFLLTFVCVATYVATINAYVVPADVKAEWEGFKADCIAEYSDVDADHLEKLKKHEFVEGDDNLKKIIFCVHKKAHIQNEDGSYNIEHSKEHLAKAYGNRDHDKDVEECTNDDHHDALKNAWAFAKCITPRVPDLKD